MDTKLSMSLDDIMMERKMEKMTPKQKAKYEKKRANQVRIAAEQEAAAQRKVEKEKLKAQRKVEYLKEQEEVITNSIAKLQREVSLEFALKDIYPSLQAAMEKYGEVELARKSPIGMRVRFTDASAAKKALNGKKLTVNVPVPVYPAEIKHHAVYFNAPEDMGDLDDDVLSQIKSAMGAHGTVVSVKKKGRSVVIFFDDRATRDSLVSVEGSSEVTIEIGDHAVALHAGLPPNIRKRRKAEQIQRQKEKEAAVLAKACGQPPPPKMAKSG